MKEQEELTEKDIAGIQTVVDPTDKLQGVICGFDVWQNELQREMSATEASDRELTG
jgi:hypothetical protein